ncbi:sulfite exporter TauE/SafE family protein [Hoeflea sp. YIM 152468]|uniref:sulfite exporter TauE/SafE family protein n=1 Tax=Hoeflea sp. YIM 152468 TaxID=3031759 RepID=UPI0023DA198B|nr:sulfite exporter TauE/SafE family protein [Hoeflea sp. YIM 152468]MDF1609054.1 sulfite exporter TauE/SafE family protein [Hoeflea sp. YIM 152468]
MIVDPAVFWLMLSGCALGGLVKGISGSGLPQIAVPLLALTTDAPTAIALVQIPSMAINIIQSRPRSQTPHALLPLWPIVTILFLSAIVGVGLLRVTPPAALFLIMAGLTFASAVFLVHRPDFALAPPLHLPIGIPAAAMAGICAGMSSLAGPILIPYLMSLRLPKDQFVATISLCYLSITIPTTVFMLYWGIVDGALFIQSGIGVVPALAGMWFGNWVRDRIDERMFRLFVLIMISASAIGLLAKALLGAGP